MKPGPGLVKCEHCEAYVKDTPRSKGAHIGYHHKEIATELFHVPTEFTIKCEICDCLVANSANVLGRHIRKIHEMEYVDYVITTKYNGTRPTCECGCGGYVDFRKGSGFDRFHSKSCSSSGSRNPMSHAVRPVSLNLGKVRTGEHRENYSVASVERWEGPTGDKVREIMKTDEYQQAQSNAQDHLYATTNHAEKVSKGVNRFWAEDPRAPELRTAACDRAIDMLDRGIIGPYGHFKTEWIFNVFTSQMEYMHSGWETEFLTRCVEEKLPVTKKHPIRIRYVASDGVKRTYVPDFVTLDGSNVIHEIKGQEDEDDLLKYEAAKMYCHSRGWTFVVHGEGEFL